jgi:hypothetical protein
MAPKVWRSAYVKGTTSLCGNFAAVKAHCDTRYRYMTLQGRLFGRESGRERSTQPSSEQRDLLGCGYTDLRRRDSTEEICERHASRSRLSSCSQNRRTTKPISVRAREEFLSFIRLRTIFAVQKASFVFEDRLHIGHPCQKHPSVKMANRPFGKRKSGLPGNEGLTFHPRTPALTSAALSRSSVVRLFAPLIARIVFARTSDTSVNAPPGSFARRSRSIIYSASLPPSPLSLGARSGLSARCMVHS